LSCQECCCSASESGTYHCDFFTFRHVISSLKYINTFGILLTSSENIYKPPGKAARSGTFPESI
jgi:hypothetical protein